MYTQSCELRFCKENCTVVERPRMCFPVNVGGGEKRWLDMYIKSLWCVHIRTQLIPAYTCYLEIAQNGLRSPVGASAGSTDTLRYRSSRPILVLFKHEKLTHGANPELRSQVFE